MCYLSEAGTYARVCVVGEGGGGRGGGGAGEDGGRGSDFHPLLQNHAFFFQTHLTPLSLPPKSAFS